MKSAPLSPQTLSLVSAIQTNEIVITFFCSLAFIALYTYWAPWWRNPLGRNIVALDAALALTLLPSVLHRLLGVSTALNPAFAWFTVVSLGAVPCVIVWRMVIMLRIQRAHRGDGADLGPRS